MFPRGIESAWIGLNDIQTEGTFVWVGPSTSYRNWRTSEPSGGIRENCVHMVPGRKWGIEWRGMWNDQSCSTKMSFICQKGEGMISSVCMGKKR